MNKKQFFQNAFMLVVSTFLLRLVFTAFRVVVSNKVGAECMGLYQLTFAIYNISVTFATSGINFAVTRLIAKALSKGDRAGAKNVMRLSFAYSLAFGVAAFLIVFALSEKIGVYLLCDKRSVLSLKAFAVSLPFISVSSAVSGYFYAARNVGTTLVSRVTEQIAQIACFYMFMLPVPKGNIELSCCAIVAASAVSEVLGSVFLILKFVLEYRGKRAKREKDAFKKLCAIALPSAAGAYLKSGLQTIENVLIPIGFRKFGASNSDALAGYGILCSMVMPVIFFPSFVFSSFSMLLIPEFTEAQTLKKDGEIKSTAMLAIRLTLMFSLFISANFIVFGQSIGDVLYTEKDAGALIKIMAPLIPFMYLDSIADGMLKGLGEYNRVLKYSSIDTVVSITMIYFVVSKYGLYGYVAVIYTSTMLNAFLSIRRLLVVSKNRLLFFSDIVVPFCASLFSAVCSKILLTPLIYTNGKTFFVVTALLCSVLLLGGFILISRGKMYDTVKYAVRTILELKPKSNFKAPCRINNN
ncbi:MAG: oligosaccharide flippase family protein [Oscillospiraceae bacterium]|nr:oligosaccharide flippase family protein [Oscillospiraceae bacterium]